MNEERDVLQLLTDPALPTSQRNEALRKFAKVGHWRPSDAFEEYPGTTELSNGHILIEHGLTNSAVITFLKNTSPFDSLPLDKTQRLLEISYNNLVDWHLFPDTRGITVVYNREAPLKPRYISVQEQRNVWRAEAFDIITGRRPSPNLRTLDDALVETVSLWKRSLSGEVRKQIPNDSISALLNGVLLVRAIEDHARYRDPNERRLLIDKWDSQTGGRQRTLRACLLACFKELGTNTPAKGFFNQKKLRVFDGLGTDTVRQFFSDFYTSRFAPYRYDFSLMSKHALSRIYEHYVSLLRDKEPQQQKLFPLLSDETTNRDIGAYYTPQFIPKFFARYLKENHTPRVFRGLRIADPSCGSGIFLRTLLEMQCDPVQDVDMTGPTRKAFQHALGIDFDPNACEATRLSLALLHLVLLEKFPKSIDVINEDALSYYQGHPLTRESFDVVVTNPPFIPWDRMKPEWREKVQVVLGNLARRKLDMFMAVLKIGMDMVKKDGYLLYVLPHSFLISEDTANLRTSISKEFWVRFVADLSEIPVFSKTGAYVILLILQKKGDKPLTENLVPPRAVVTRCRDLVGIALQEALEGRLTKKDYYDIFEVEQANFKDSEWHLLPPEQSRLHSRLSTFACIADFMEVRQGFVTGLDDAFVRNASDIPKGEEAVYRPYLTDRDMRRYASPKKVKKAVFYPFIGTEAVGEAELRRHFPITWNHLERFKAGLDRRFSVEKRGNPWWRPENPRPPEKMLRPKIVVPHLVLVPRFALDQDGRYAVSHCPLLYPKEEADVDSTQDLLRYFLAILNSSVCHWQISHLSHKYSRGYAMLEVSTLKAIRVPDPARVPLPVMKNIKELIGRLLNAPSDESLHNKLNKIVASDLYSLTEAECREIGMETKDA